MSSVPPPDHRPAKRIRQACEPCRRKKSRCPGERPSCSHCSRLAQTCYYASDHPAAADHQHSTADSTDANRERHGSFAENVDAAGPCVPLSHLHSSHCMDCFDPEHKKRGRPRIYDVSINKPT
ncbi:Regulatory protein CAT8 [Diplodia seriata]|uniref:Regulatory protein CAT8 n=1 Tax=Diplodia seriata TaxID=420778 RepID=A0A1S8BFH3_9PEZI|nr:Regulatory protein CAT8 [Diplodia seriata]